MISANAHACAAIESLQFEVEALEGFARELFLEVNEQRANRTRAEWAKTMWGRIADVWAACFSLYCLYKLVMVCDREKRD